MNLVVSALESMSGNCKEVIDSGFLDCHEDQLREVKALNDAVTGCFRVINDLNICKESLEQSGYSQQWLDIINKDNKFLTLCNIEMPKFFGGDETKGKACMEGIMDTLKVWLKKGWEILKKIYAFLMATIKTLLDFYKGMFGNKFDVNNLSKMRETWKKHYEDISKKTEAMDTITGNEVYIKVLKSEDLERYMTIATSFLSRINLALEKYGKPIQKNANPGITSFMTETLPGDTGNAVLDVYTHIAQLATEAGASHNLQKDGFIVKPNGIEFLTLDAFPTEQIDLLNDKEWERVKDMLVKFKDTLKMHMAGLDHTQKNVAAYQKTLETLIENGQSINSSITLEETQRALQRTQAMYQAITSIVAYNRTLTTGVEIMYSTILNATRKK